MKGRHRKPRTPSREQGQVLWDAAAQCRHLSCERLDSGHHGTPTPTRSSHPAWPRSSSWSPNTATKTPANPSPRPSPGKRLRRCRLCSSNAPSSQCLHRPMVRRLGISFRATLCTDSPALNPSNTACWLFHQYWRRGDKQAGRREHVPRHPRQKNRWMINRPNTKASPSPRGVLRLGHLTGRPEFPGRPALAREGVRSETVR